MPNPSIKRIVLLLLATLCAAGAHAQGKTRDQVRAEFEAARRAGTLLGAGESSLTLREQQPQNFAAHQAIVTKTREEVLAELDVARRSGNLLAAGDAGLLLNEVHPQSYPARALAQGRTRDEVRAELREATRNGDILGAGEAAVPLNQLRPERYARQPHAPNAPMAAASAPIAALR
jgi:predicted RNase H-like HicB family nuclease